MFLWDFLECFLDVEVDGVLIFIEVHKGIGGRVVNLQSIVVVDFIIFVFVASMGLDLEDDERRQSFGNFYFECTFPGISCFQNSLQICLGLHMPENYFASEF